MSEATRKESLSRINAWLDTLTDKARELMDAIVIDEFTDMTQIAQIALKCIATAARLLELREQMSDGEDEAARESELRQLFQNELKYLQEQSGESGAIR